MSELAKTDWGYRVTGHLDFTVRADTPDEAIETAYQQCIAMLEETDMLPAIRGSHFDRNALTAEKIEYTAEELAETEQWMAANLATPHQDTGGWNSGGCAPRADHN